MSLITEAQRILGIRNNIRTLMISLNMISDLGATLSDCNTALNSSEVVPKRDASDITKNLGVIHIPKGYYNETITISISEYIVSLPTQTGTLTYTGGTLIPTWSSEYDSTKMDIAGDMSNTEAGDHIVTFTPKTGYHWSDGTRIAKEQTWKISKAVGLCTAPTAKSLTYNGLAQDLVLAGSSSTGTLKYKITGGSYSSSIPLGTNANSYTVYFYSEGDNNHLDTIEDTIAISIARASAGAKPSGTVTKWYKSGQTQTNDYDKPVGIDIVEGTDRTSSVETVTAKYKPDSNHCWSDGTLTQESKTLVVNIYYLYYYGEEYSSITGGWTAYRANVTVTAKKYASSMFIASYHSWYNGSLITNNTIDFTGFTKVCSEYSLDHNYAATRISDEKNADPLPWNYQTLHAVGTNQIHSHTLVPYELTGSHYVCLTAYGLDESSSVTTKFDLYRVWLE